MKKIKILNEIYKYTKDTGDFPSMKELCSIIGMVPTIIMNKHTQQLKKEGYIDIEEDIIALTQKGINLVEAEEETKLKDKDYTVLLSAEKFLRENEFPLMEEFEDVISKIACLLNKN